MKRVLSMIIGAIGILIVGMLILRPVNAWIWDLRGLEGGYDDEMKMFNIVVFIEWPVLILIGALLGNFVYKKYFLGKSKSLQ